MQNSVYELQNAAVGYRGQVLIHDICLTVRAGEIVTLIGPNGAGKSTILKTMAKQLEPIGGSLYLNGRVLHRVNYGELAKEVSVLLTNRIAPELMTNRDVVESGRYPYTGRMGILSDEDRRIAEETMELVGITNLADRLFTEISDGQKQRVLFARALCQSPRILILDEPTSYLDIRYQLELLEVLKRLAKQRKLTVILSLHEIDLAQKISDRVVCVKGDTIFRIGTPEEIFQRELIAELYGIKTGSFDPLLGSVELPVQAGAAKILVISSGGNGIPTYRRLVRDGVPFAAGILYENDIDCHVARSLGAKVIAEQPFVPLGDAAVEEALQLVESVEQVILHEVPLTPLNARLSEVVAAADARGRLVRA